ncbi:MAG: sugar kinase [Gaiellaceae bacterium]
MVRAEATLTLAAPKDRLRAPGATDAVGELFLADISIPRVVYTRLGIDFATPFAATQLLRVTAL